MFVDPFRSFLAKINGIIFSFVTVLDQVMFSFGEGHEFFFQVSEFTAKLDDEVIGLFFFVEPLVET